MTEAEFEQWLIDPGRRPLVMGILNVTPDSFSDGGRFDSTEAAVEQARRMAAEGADLIDIGGESTRPGSARVPADEQVRRILPVLRGLEGRIGTVLSVDTTSAQVARVAMDCGVRVVNDISAGREDAALFPLVAARGAAMVLMHMQGEPATMQVAPKYEDVVAEVMGFLGERLEVAESAGIAPYRLLVDPGIGFGKTLEHNLTLLRELSRFAQLGRPVLVGTSRKGFLGKITGKADPESRLFATAATVAWSIAQGAAVVRVHDVAAMVDVVRTVRAICGSDR